MEIFRDGKQDVGGDRLHVVVQGRDFDSLAAHGYSVIRFAQNTTPIRAVRGWDLMDRVWVSLSDPELKPEPQISTDPGGDIYVDLPNHERLRDYQPVIKIDITEEDQPELALRGLTEAFLHNVPNAGKILFPKYRFQLPE